MVKWYEPGPAVNLDGPYENCNDNPGGCIQDFVENVYRGRYILTFGLIYILTVFGLIVWLL